MTSPDEQKQHHNQPEFSVSELSGALKRTVEGAFSHVRVRGEISQPKLAGSGHCYLRLKDDSAVLDAVIWRGVMSKLGLRPEEGMEVIATGRLTTYAGRSSYQLVVESMELAGEGALLKLLEDRKRKLTAEGLFDKERKRPLPFLPRVIGIVTSPTGAVIRDMLHRLADRFPRHVLVIPVRVQGEGAAEEIAAAVKAFNRLQPGQSTPRPDVLIVARGGGSLEDLWAFNEEVVVRAVAESDIPVISAVGHETDTTLIDYAADRRAPTPTGAAEFAVPVRLELLAQVREDDARLTGAVRRMLDDKAMRLEGLSRGLPDLNRLLEDATQRLDDRTERLNLSIQSHFKSTDSRIAQLAAGLRSPAETLSAKSQQLESAKTDLARNWRTFHKDRQRDLENLAARLSLRPIEAERQRGEKRIAEMAERLDRAFAQKTSQLTERFEGLGARLESNSYKRILERGYAAITDADGSFITSSKQTETGQALHIAMADGQVDVVVGKGGKKSSQKPKSPPSSPKQESLF